MTDRQINAAKETLPQGIGSWEKSTEEQKQLDRELRCRDMINSILIYYGEEGLFDENGNLSQYLRKYADSNEEFFHLGKERVLELIDEQCEDFKFATVKRNVWTDSEGVTYNSCIWGDEK